MHDTAKYLIHADIRASGVVERSDVVGAVFGQTEGLLGDDLDLRDLQESGKLGRIDVEVTSERGSSFGEITIASGLDKVETAILAAGLESIDRVGPCRADIEVADIEDVRSAKRREVVERAKELLAEFDERTLSSEDLVAEVRRSIRVADITEFHGMPAGPRVEDSDAVVVVEGRSDVQTLLGYGVKNAIAVEGTDVPDEVAEMTHERTVTAFLDGDRGGDLILKELAQVGDIDYVALAPTGRSVEDLERDEIMSALRDKVPFEAVSEEEAAELAATDGSTRPAPPEAVEENASDGAPAQPDAGPSTTIESERSDGEPPLESVTSDAGVDSPDDSPDLGVDSPDPNAAETGVSSRPADESDGETAPETTGEITEKSGDGSDEITAETDDRSDDESTEKSDGESSEKARTLASHVDDIVDGGSGRVRLLDGDHEVIAEGPAADAFDLIESAEEIPRAVVLDADVSQRVLDIAAQRGVGQVVARGDGEYVKQPTSVRVRLAAEFAA